MTGRFIDHLIYSFASKQQRQTEGYCFVDTSFGKIRVLDTKGNKPCLINVPDGPNVIEHQLPLIKKLSADFRVICFEYPGLGRSYPSRKFNYSFLHGAMLLFEVMDVLKAERASLLFSCSNGFYAMQATQINPDRFQRIFLSQTPSTSAMMHWTKKSIPNVLKIPIIGQVVNQISKKRLIKTWYKYALTKDDPNRNQFENTALQLSNNGACFCLSSLMQGLRKDQHKKLQISAVPMTLVWGANDFTHRNTDQSSILTHAPDCEIIVFEKCGHFPELEDSDRYVRLIREHL